MIFKMVRLHLNKLRKTLDFPKMNQASAVHIIQTIWQSDFVNDYAYHF
jgi:hypothetical protein